MTETMTRRRFLKVALGGTLGFGVVGIGGSAYITRIEPYALDVARLTLPLPGLDPAFDGLTIAQISDIHLGAWMTLEQMQSLVERINALEADVVAATGDFVSRLWSQTPGEITASLRGLTAREGLYAVLGNHDHWTDADTVGAAVAASGFALLNNTHSVLRRGGAALYILGVDDVWENKHNLGHALTGVPEGAATILLAHEPDFADHVARTRRIGLQLSGHSHGGQVRLPGKGALVLPHLARKYDMGLYTVPPPEGPAGDTPLRLYVNRGLGMTAPYVRFNCPPEVTLITLATPDGSGQSSVDSCQ